MLGQRCVQSGASVRHVARTPALRAPPPLRPALCCSSNALRVRAASAARLRWRGGAPPHAANSDRTIESLDKLLGSSDSLDSVGSLDDADGRRSKRRQPKTPAAARRVRPLYVYVIYYIFICVYLTTAWLEATEGDLAASDFVDQLVNDHLAVAGADVGRLLSSGFVCEDPLALFMQLATLATVGAEAEALLGYSLFWAVYWLASMGGAAADAAFADLPLTYGPANAAAGMVGALVAYYGRNWKLEERIDEARVAARAATRAALAGYGNGNGTAGAAGASASGGDAASASASSELEGARPSAAGDGSGAAASTSGGSDGGGGGARRRRGAGALEEAEAEVEVLPLVPLKFAARMSAEARGTFNVLVAAVVAGQGLLEFGGASSTASFVGLAAAFWTGLILSYGAGPEYAVITLPAASTALAPQQQPQQQQQQETQQERRQGARQGQAGSGGGGGQAEEGDADGLRVVDVAPLLRRQLVLGGYAASLAAAVAGWVMWMGADL